MLINPLLSNVTARKVSVFNLKLDSKPKIELKYLPEDVNPNGKLPLILSARDAEQIQGIKRNCQNFGKEDLAIKEDLSVIGGLLLEVAPKKLEEFMKTLPSDVKLVVDKPSGYQMPEPIRQPKSGFFKLNNVVRSFNFDKLYNAGFTGKGIGIAIIDSGIYPHPDIKERIIKFKNFDESDINSFRDNFGHGTHVAGIAAGNGRASGGMIKGAAPDANIIALKIGPKPSQAIKALIWAVQNKDKFKIRVINMSLGEDAKLSYKNDLWTRAAEFAWDSGIFVVVAAGNEGPAPRSITTPGIDPKVLTVANVDDCDTPSIDDDRIYMTSSRGPTPIDNLFKPDIAAPGTNIISTLAPDSFLAKDRISYPHIDCNRDGIDDYFVLTGTSMATPLVAGLAADLIEAMPSIKPDQLKKILMQSADPLPDYSAYAQGRGIIDPGEALDLTLKLKKNGEV